LVTQKRADFEILKQIVEIIKSKRHLTVEGLQEIVNLKASLNLGLSDDLKAAFPNTVPVFRPKINFKFLILIDYLVLQKVNLVFFVSVYKSLKSKLGSAVQLVFKITQHSRDEELLKGIVEY